MKRIWGILVVVWLILGSAGAYADGDAEQKSNLSEEDRALALVHFQKGEARFSQREYRLAIEHFQMAYDITKSPEILYNIAMCYEELHETALAVENYNEYLQNSNGEDAPEIKQKIEALGGKVEPRRTDDDEQATNTGASNAALAPVDEPAEKKDDTQKKKKHRLDHFAFELGMGPAFVLLTPDTGVVPGATGQTESNKNNYFSIDMLGHFFLNDWFAISGVILIGPYMGREDDFVSRDPKRHLGIGAGIGMKKRLKGRTSLFTNLLGSICTIKRDGITKRATWFAFDIRFGMNIMVTKKFDINLMAVAEGGPAMVIHPSGQDWDNGLLVSVGPRFGFTYHADKK